MGDTERARRGFTLVEVVVVLLLMGLAAALVAPALAPRRQQEAGLLAGAVERARTVAIRRGEVVTLRIDRSGAWYIAGTASAGQGLLAAGRLEATLGASVTLVLSPLGSCGVDVGSEDGASALGIDPASCELRAP